MAVRKDCPSCGASFEAKRATAKYCSNRCRQRAFQRSGAPNQSELVTPSPVVDEPEPTGKTAMATTAELERAGRLDTAVGQAALVLARRIDASSTETGSSLASLVREHRATLAEAVRDVDGAADPLDELRTRRERKLAGG